MRTDSSQKKAKQNIRGPALFLHRSIGVVEVFAAMLALFRDGEDLFPAHRAALGRFRCGDRERFAAGGTFDALPGEFFFHFKMLAAMWTIRFHKNTSMQFHLMKYSIKVSDVKLFRLQRR